MRGYTCQQRWIQCRTHPLSVLCLCGYCRYYHCTRRQSVDACSHSIVVRAEGPLSSSTDSKDMWGESVNLRPRAAKVKKGCSKKKVLPNTSKGQILSFVITFCSALPSTVHKLWTRSHSVHIEVYVEIIFRDLAFILIPLESAGLLVSRCASTHYNPPHRPNHVLIYEAGTHNTRINPNPRKW